MAHLLKMTNTPLPNELLLIGGSSYPFKISGFGSDKKHVIIKCNSRMVTVTVLNAKPNSIEQTLKLEVTGIIGAGFKAQINAWLGSDPSKRDTSATVSITIEPRIKLPAEDTEEGVVSRMLLVENITPGQPAFISSQQTQASMQCMVWVLRNRMTLGSHNFGTSQDVSSLMGLIKAKNQIAGFENYPAIAASQNSLLNDILKFANDASRPKCAVFRQYVRDAIGIANGSNPGTDPCPTKLYGWRTAGATSPGSNFVKFNTLGGQDFYTLTGNYVKSVSK